MTVTRKWRPSLALVIGTVCMMLIALPVVGVLAARLTSNQFVRETERSLLAQATLYGESYALAYAALEAEPRHGMRLTAAQRAARAEKYTPVAPSLRVFRGETQGPRPDPQVTPRPITAPYSDLGETLTALAKAAQKTNLAGYMALDAYGRVIGGTATAGYSMAHIPEVRAALDGTLTSVLRWKSDTTKRHPLNSISRNTAYRVFVARPVIVADRVVGAVYLSRTPLDLKKFVYQERITLLLIAGIMLAGSALVGGLLWRFISGPIRGLREQSQQVAAGERHALEPLRGYGVRELADLGRSVLSMSSALTDRSLGIETYTAHVTHELKSPVTTITGAAELLENDPPLDRRTRLIRSIGTEAKRMNVLLEKLRELAHAKVVAKGEVPLSNALAALGPLPVALHTNAPATAMLPLSAEQAEIVLTQLLRNAAENGATDVTLTWSGTALTLHDNGTGISEPDRKRLLDPFFTTRRDQGGTGMGLAIVRAVIEGQGGSVIIDAPPEGASFTLRF